MATKRIFYITANTLSVFLWNTGRIESGPCFNIKKDGLTAFSEYLSHDNDTLTYCLADLVEEQFNHDTIPHVSGSDRKILLSRKKRQLFRHTPYNGAVVQGRESTGRRNDKVLYMGVTNPDTLSVWLTQAQQHKVPIAGVYSLAELAQTLTQKLNIKSANTLMFTQQSLSGFRQTFLNSGQVKVSRLSQSKQFDENEYNSVVISEVFRNQKYLQRLRLLENNAPLDVYIFGDGRQHATLNETFIDTADIKYHFVDEKDVGEVIGLKNTVSFGYFEYLFIHLLCKSKPAINYAQPSNLHYSKMYQARKAMLAASVLLVVSSLSWSVVNSLDTYNIERQNSHLLQDVNELQQKHDKAFAKLPTLTTTARDMQHTVETADQLAKNRTNPAFAMIAISRGLASHPNIFVDEIDWVWSDDPKTPLSENQQGIYDEGNMENEQASSNLYQIAIIRARVSPFDGNFDYAFSQVNSFINELRGNTLFKEVLPLKLPLDTNPTSSLTGVTGYKQEQSLASFEIRVVLSVSHENT